MINGPLNASFSLEALKDPHCRKFNSIICTSFENFMCSDRGDMDIHRYIIAVVCNYLYQS